MKAVEFITTEEVYQVAYITMRGWEPNYDFTQWKKEGHTHKVPVLKYDKHGHFDSKEDSEWFDLDDAFWRAQENVDKMERF